MEDTGEHTEGGDPACWAHLFEDPPTPPSEQTIAELVRNLADGVIVCDRDGLITFWNEASSQIFGWDREQVLGKPLDVIIPEQFRKQHWDGYKSVMETGETRYGRRLVEAPTVHHDGHMIPIAFTLKLVKGTHSSDPEGVAAVIHADAVTSTSEEVPAVILIDGER